MRSRLARDGLQLFARHVRVAVILHAILHRVAKYSALDLRSSPFAELRREQLVLARLAPSCEHYVSAREFRNV